MINVRKYTASLEGKPVAVFGLGLSGLSTVKALKKAGARIIAWDDNEAPHEKARALGAEIKELNQVVLSGVHALILSPGVPLYFPEPHPVVKVAHAANIEIIGDIEIFYRSRVPGMTVGITGTNGKSTTTALTAHALNACGRKSVAGGNIGKAVLDLEPVPLDGAYVLELSSYQIDLCKNFKPDIAVLLNITPDHIDRYGGMEGYVASKERLFAGQGAAVIAVDDDHSRGIYDRLKKYDSRKLIPVSSHLRVNRGVYYSNNMLFDDTEGKNAEIGTLGNIQSLNGAHNKQNAVAAYAVARALGCQPAEILAGFKTYTGLPHRQFLVRILNGVSYINDSKATNADATGHALAAYQNIYWIVGGRAKEEGLEGLGTYAGHIKHAFLIGEAAKDFSAWMKNYNIPHHISETLENAVYEAHEMAQHERGQPGGAGVVLLSPACASFDQFTSFEHRGNHFTDLVTALKEEAA